MPTAKRLSLEATGLRGQGTGLQGRLQREGTTSAETLITGEGARPAGTGWGDGKSEGPHGDHEESVC